MREAVGVFDSIDALQAAVDDLAMAGFAQHELSLMAADETIRDRLGSVYSREEMAKQDPDAPRQAYVAPEEVGNAQGIAIGGPAYVGAILAAGAVVATGGTALAAAAAAALGGGAGGGLGTVLAGWIGAQREQTLRQHLDKGGLLLWVNLRDAERERLARDILPRHASQPVEIHEIPQTGSG
ncbi:hypothetical protein [Rhodospirillum centenum]|uniref:hypothetical protein n=1 Tax=Rhodospirillum centenum TaxID=34018 RepID=UPI0002E3E074|nr:hypothetical protein [Rhodospirillum centenum]